MNVKIIVTTLTIVILLILIRNISFSIYTLIQNEGIVKDLRSQLEEERKEFVFLNQRLSEVQSDNFIEKEAREKLGLVRENEYPVFLTPPSPLQNTLGQSKEENWKKWKNVFRL
jgi:cell division protein FtsB